jgi:S-adenosyl methyltransferase
MLRLPPSGKRTTSIGSAIPGYSTVATGPHPKAVSKHRRRSSRRRGLRHGRPRKAARQAARHRRPAARTSYVDYDRVVVTHARALLEKGSDGVLVVEGDLRGPARIIGEAKGRIDFSEPVAVLLFAVLHFLTDADDPHAVVASLAGHLAPGSAVAISHLTGEGTDLGKSLAAQCDGPCGRAAGEERAGRAWTASSWARTRAPASRDGRRTSTLLSRRHVSGPCCSMSAAVSWAAGSADSWHSRRRLPVVPWQ